MQALLDVILPVFLVIGFGYVSVWGRVFPENGVDALMKFTQHFAIPCLLFQAIANLDLSVSLDAGLLLSFYVGAACGFLLGFSIKEKLPFSHFKRKECVGEVPMVNKLFL